MDNATLRARLRGIVSPGREAGSVSSQSHARPTEATNEGVPAAGESASLEAVLGGAWCAGDGAQSFVVRRRIPGQTPHGRFTVGDLAARLSASQSSAALLASGASRGRFCFFDLETTGLSGGAGTHAFLVGYGWFEEDGAFVSEQHLLTDYAAERAMLTVVAGALADAGTLVTFNGKSFDAPVLETRYLLHRLSSPCADLPHLDVLHPARRLWGDDDRGCTLGALEQRLLGATRTGDVPGMEIPARYFQFVRTADARPLAAVLEHNRLDLLSLAGVASHLLGLIDAGPATLTDAGEALALGRIYERTGDWTRAGAAFEHALALADHCQRAPSGGRPRHGAADTVVRVEALRALALSARRARRFAHAADLWSRLLETPGCPLHVSREATEALAIHHEHRARDLAAAKMFALKGLDAGGGAAWGDAVRHRLARIERKMVSETRPLFPSLPLLPSCGSPTSEPRTSS